MGDGKRRALAILDGGSAGSGLNGGTPDTSPPAPSIVARKQILGVVVDDAKAAVVLQCRGPLDVTTIDVELPFIQLEHLAGQIIVARCETLLNAAERAR